jgi:hypothetical protein
MSLAALLNADDPLYNFEHQMAHREYFAIMSPLDRFSALPYHLDAPPLDNQTPAGDWNLRHQIAHNDFTNALPPFWDASQVGFGIPADQNMIDGDWSAPGSRQWIIFVNHQEHFTANEAILPLPVTVPTPPGWWSDVTLRYPFW